jgi:hypothetical protein
VSPDNEKIRREEGETRKMEKYGLAARGQRTKIEDKKTGGLTVSSERGNWRKRKSAILSMGCLAKKTF